jgi:ABC-2 type transport system ATP-binding protein
VSAVIETERLGRWYGQVVGLNELTLAVGPGVTGLVGPNGAGKSTFLKLVAGEIRPSRGRLRVLGHAPFANRDYYRRMGFCPQQDALYDDMSGLQMVTYLLRLGGFPRAEARERAGRALDRVGLAQGRERKLSTYSKGMRQRVKLAQAIAHEPELLVVDEPLTGLDPLGRAELSDLFRELGEAGLHILISSHVLHEVESLTQRVVLLHRGRLLAQGSVGEIRSLLDRHPRRVEIGLREPRRLARRLIELEDVTSVRLEEERLSIETRDLERFYRGLTAVAAEERAGLRALKSADASLEAIFDYLVG